MRILIGLLIALLLVAQYRLWISDDGFPAVWRLEEALATQHEQNRELLERNRQLAAEVADLKSQLEAVEEIARTDLGMVGPDETIFQVVEKDGDAQDPAQP